MDETTVQRELTIEEMATQARAEIEKIGKFVFTMKANSALFQKSTSANADHGEAIANIMLAYRHLEDARMRLGKVFQAMNGGISNSER